MKNALAFEPERSPGIGEDQQKYPETGFRKKQESVSKGLGIYS
jgi:hypothetical protein